MTKIALLGLGNVGRAFARYLERSYSRHSFRIVAAADVSGGIFLDDPGQLPSIAEKLERGLLIRDCTPHRSLVPVQEYLNRLPAAGIGVLVECMPTNIADGQPALDYLETVLLSGIPAVTVDKGPMVYGFKKLSEAARHSGVEIAYTGTTGVRPPSEIAGSRIGEIEGILNGTTNYILTQMLERSISFSDALADAQKQGIAEPNPTLDTDGWDTASKILILANRCLDAGASLAEVARVGIGTNTESLILEARASGRVVRLIGRARASEPKAQLSVAPELIDPESPFFSISGTSKGAVFTTEDGRRLFSESRSGREAIAQTILEDVRAVTAPSKLGD